MSVEGVQVTFPSQDFRVFEFEQHDHRGVATIDAAWAGFEHSLVFRWQLSLILELEDLREDLLPTRAELERLRPWETQLEAELLDDDGGKPNAILLGTINWNGSREIIFRVHDPEVANAVLTQRLDTRDYVRPFDYRMEDDPSWDLARWHLDAVGPSREPS